MSELQFGLLAVGALVVVCVLGFNKYQEMRARRVADRHFASGHEDVLLNAGAAADPGDDDELPPPAHPRVEPAWHEPDPDPVPARDDQPAFDAVHARGPSSVLAVPSLDARIDFIAELGFADPLLGSHLAMELERLGTARIVGCDGYNQAVGAWEGLDRDAVYEVARLGVQLSDRGGPLRQDELEQFQQWVAEVAERLGAEIAWTGMQSPLTRAAELDAFCAEVDVQISVNLVAPVALPETKIRGLAEANGFKRDGDNVYRRRGDDGMELLSLRLSAPTAVSLIYDVPRVPRDAAAFGMMMQCARIIGKGLDAKLVDDNGRPLDEAMQARIQSSLAGIHARMDAASMPAGGALALRVFA